MVRELFVNVASSALVALLWAIAVEVTGGPPWAMVMTVALVYYATIGRTPERIP